MVHEFAKNRPTVDVIREQLKMEPEASTRTSSRSIDKETGKTVDELRGLDQRLGELNQLRKDGKNDEVIAKGRALEVLYPDYVETGNAYLVRRRMPA